MRLVDVNYVLEILGRFNDRKHGNKHFFYGIETATEIIEAVPTINAVMLPFKVGETVYLCRKEFCDVNRLTVVSYKVRNWHDRTSIFMYCEENPLRNQCRAFPRYKIKVDVENAVGKTVFLNRAEAEAALNS